MVKNPEKFIHPDIHFETPEGHPQGVRKEEHLETELEAEEHKELAEQAPEAAATKKVEIEPADPEIPPLVRDLLEGKVNPANAEDKDPSKLLEALLEATNKEGKE